MNSLIFKFIHSWTKDIKTNYTLRGKSLKMIKDKERPVKNISVEKFVLGVSTLQANKSLSLVNAYSAHFFIFLYCGETFDLAKNCYILRR